MKIGQDKTNKSVIVGQVWLYDTLHLKDLLSILYKNHKTYILKENFKLLC